MMPVASRFGDRLRKVRERQHVSQTALAARSGISRVSIVSMETQGTDVKLSTVQKLAEALRVPLAELLDSEATGDGVTDRLRRISRLFRDLAKEFDELAGSTVAGPGPSAESGDA